MVGNTPPQRADPPDRAPRADARRPRRPGDVDAPTLLAHPRGQRRPEGPGRPARHHLRGLRALGQPGPRPRAGRPDADPDRGDGRLPGRGARRSAATTAGRSSSGACWAWPRCTRRPRSTGSRPSSRPWPTPPWPGSVLVCVYLNGGNDGLNMVVPIGSRVRRLPVQAPQPGAGARPHGGHPGGHHGDPRHRRPARLGQRRRLGGGQQRRHPGLRHALRSRRRRARRGPGAVPGRGLHAAQPVALRQPRLLVRRRAAEGPDRVAGALARRVRVAQTNPLQAVSIDTSLSKQIRTSRRPGQRDLQPERRQLPARQQRRHQRDQRDRQPGRQPGDPGQRPAWPGRAGRTASPCRSRARSPAWPPPNAAAGGYPNSDLSRKLQIAATLHRRGPGHPDRHHRLGLLRHPRQPAREPGPAAHDALARPGGLQGRPGGARGRAERGHAGLLGVRAAHRLQRVGHRPRGGRVHDGAGLVRVRRPGRRPPGRDERRLQRRPAGDDGLPERLPGAHRRVARRRPRRGDARAAGRSPRWPGR